VRGSRVCGSVVIRGNERAGPNEGAGYGQRIYSRTAAFL
jgi:hypothetical protein